MLHALQTDKQALTVPRRAIVEWIGAAHTLFTAEDVVNHIGGLRGYCSRATVYRALDWLRTYGWVKRLQLPDMHIFYVRLLPGQHHVAVCMQCNKVFVITGCSVDACVLQTLTSINFAITNHVLEVYGTCDQCIGHIKRTSEYIHRHD